MPRKKKPEQPADQHRPPGWPLDHLPPEKRAELQDMAAMLRFKGNQLRDLLWDHINKAFPLAPLAEVTDEEIMCVESTIGGVPDGSPDEGTSDEEYLADYRKDCLVAFPAVMRLMSGSTPLAKMGDLEAYYKTLQKADPDDPDWQAFDLICTLFWYATKF